MKNNITEETYFNKENELKYCGSSQIKSFQKCEAATMAKLNGEWEEDPSIALLVGSYVDSYYEGSLEKFKEKNPQIFKKDGELKSEYKKAEEIITRLKQDKLFSKYMSGEKQVIMTGIIEEVPIKIKIDSYHKDKCICDLKIMADMKPIWNDETKQKENFVYYYGYHYQAALYQEIVRQNTGKQLPFFLCVATKENVTDFAILNIPQDILDEALNEIKIFLPRIKELKEKKAKPTKCHKCSYCKKNKILKEIIDFRDI